MEIRLTSGQVALVDDADYALVVRFSWTLTNGYAKSRDEHGRTAYMHRLIMGLHGASRREQVDHINRNKLDNRRANLRHCTFRLNQANRPRQRTQNQTSDYKGVHRKTGAWAATIMDGLSSRHLGHFDVEGDAARAYDVAAAEKYGEYAQLNFPGEPLLTAGELNARRRPGRGKYARRNRRSA